MQEGGDAMVRTQWFVAVATLICAINCSASDGPTTVDNDGGSGGTTMMPPADGGSSGTTMIPPTDGCTMNGGGTCSCVLTCGMNVFVLECDGSACTCIKNGSPGSKFEQGTACSFSGDTKEYAYGLILLGCPGAYPCAGH